MGVPYQCLSPLGKGTLFCAAKGCSIQTFDLSTDPQLLFTWSHPSLKQAEKGSLPEKAQHDKAGNGEQAQEQQPPSKRRKVEDSQDAKGGAGAGGENGQETPDTLANGEKTQQKNKSKGQPPEPELPFVILLTATEDGSHAIAVTGQDKTLWVFEHDGKGSLKEVSQRVMPKRPCSLALTADGNTILSADKFGDVYALPLVPSPGDESSRAASASSTPAPVTQPPKGANTFTVHSQRNRRALEDQLRQREANVKRDLPKEGPTFAHHILLGHVSMLTRILSVKDSQGRPYIITADRDEHIRVSRGIPQTHVIETYCLGHGSFVNALCTPLAARGEILVSGGGDDALYVWDWLRGKLLGTTDLLTHVRAVRPDAAKIAVAKLFAYELDGECHIVAICERIPALFIFQLHPNNNNTLTHLATLTLRGNPLDITALGSSGQTLLVAIDPINSNNNNESLLVLGPEGTTWGEAGTVQGSTSEEDMSISRKDLDKALYTVENLRKTEFDEGGDHEGDQAGSAAGGGEAAPELTPEQQASDTKMEVE